MSLLALELVWIYPGAGGGLEPRQREPGFLIRTTQVYWLMRPCWEELALSSRCMCDTKAFPTLVNTSIVLFCKQG